MGTFTKETLLTEGSTIALGKTTYDLINICTEVYTCGKPESKEGSLSDSTNPTIFRKRLKDPSSKDNPHLDLQP